IDMHGRRAQRGPEEFAQPSRRGAARFAGTAGRMGLRTPPLALYVHFPWCVRKCPYCDFNSHTLHQELPQRAYLDALLVDLDAQLPQLEERSVSSVFLGGGTPSLFAPEAIGELLSAVRARLPL